MAHDQASFNSLVASIYPKKTFCKTNLYLREMGLTDRDLISIFSALKLNQEAAASIISLNLSMNGYSVTPELNPLVNLEILVLDNNRMQYAPDTTCCTRLKYFNISNNPLNLPPSSLLNNLALIKVEMHIPTTTVGSIAMAILREKLPHIVFICNGSPQISNDLLCFKKDFSDSLLHAKNCFSHEYQRHAESFITASTCLIEKTILPKDLCSKIISYLLPDIYKQTLARNTRLDDFFANIEPYEKYKENDRCKLLDDAKTTIRTTQKATFTEIEKKAKRLAIIRNLRLL